MQETVRAFTALSEEFVEVHMRHHPVTATRVGLHDYDDRLPDDSPEGVEAETAWLRDFEQRLVASVPWQELPTGHRVDYALLRARISALRARLEDLKRPATNPVLYTETALNAIYMLMARPFAPLEERKEPLLARMMALPEYFESARRNLKNVPAAVLAVTNEVNSSGPAFVDDVVRSLLRTFPGEAERIEHAGSRARMAFLQYQEYLDQEVRPHAVPSFAIGERWMNHLLEREHMLPFDCKALDQLGRDQAARALAQLEREAERLAPGRTWQQQIAEARKRHPEPLRVRDAYVAEVERARRFVEEKHLAPLPSAPIEVVDTPLFERALVPYASYLPPAPFDHEQTGYLYVTPIDIARPREEQRQRLAGHAYGNLPLIVAHEAIPGHHLQVCHANQSGSRLRRLAESDVFAEGWALYCEDLMHAHGFFLDPVSRLFQLQDLLWRACRVVVDVGLHSGRMSMEEAADYLVQEAMLERSIAESEVKRYVLTPTEPMSYVVGRALITELRDEAAKRLGDRFDLYEFHAALLAGGALPPALVREELWERLPAGDTAG